MSPELPWDSSMLSAELGYFAMPNLLVGVTYMTMTMTMSGAGPTQEQDTVALGAAGKWVERLGGETAVNVEVGYVSETDSAAGFPDETNAEISLAADYYPTQLVGLGAGVAMNSGDDASEAGRKIRLRLRWNLDTRLGAGVSYSMFTPDDSAEDESTTLALSITGRF